MSEQSDAEPLLKARKSRRAAHALVREDLKLLQDGLADRPVGQRIKDAAADKLIGAVDTARDVAAENKVVIGGTLAALAAWFLRAPLLRGIEAAWEKLKDLGAR